MRHRKSGRKLGRKSSHRHAMFRNMVTSLIEHEQITTTEAKAKELRRFADRTIAISLRLGDLLEKPKADRTAEEQARYVHALRMAGRMIRTREVLHKLFDQVAPKMKGRPGGFTRLIRVGPRPGDAAPMMIVELVQPAAPAAQETAS
ncbi:MAG TPA: 50S ribosomal protein L17 [Nannocystaceae bacterium]|nr:50S ribosomal protein L17 [Nannocystaceae bacterium]